MRQPLNIMAKDKLNAKGMVLREVIKIPLN